jgi:4-amino-4-deoxy-L-arabinose transferase-like glycosyltransferase
MSLENLRFRHALWILLALTALLYLPGTGTIPLMDRDEPRFAHATVEMMERSEWVIPYFNEDYRFDKPPLTYWWMRLHYNLLGINELSARLHSVLSVWLVGCVIWCMGRRLYSAKAGWIGAFAWLTSFQALVHGRLCVADMPMILCVTLSMWALIELLAPRDHVERLRFGRWFWILWVSLGVGFLAKGPIAWFVPGLSILLWRWALWRKPLPWSRLQWRLGPLITLAMVAAWGIPALILTNGEFWRIGMGEHVVDRGTAALNGRVIVPGYYIVAAFISLMPWIAWLPQIWSKLRTEWNRESAFLVSWFLAPQIIFFLYATQLPHYTMPGFAAFFLLLGSVLSEERKLGWFGWAYLTFILAVSISLFFISKSNSFPQIPKSLSTVLGSVALLLFMLSSIGLIFAKNRGIVFNLVMIAFIIGCIGYDIRAIHPVVAMQSVIKGSKEQGEAVAWQFTEPSLVFYGERPFKMLSKIKQIEDRMRKGKTDIIVCENREWTLNHAIQQWRKGEAQTTDKDFSADVERLSTLATQYDAHDFAGFNLARASWVEIRVWKHKAKAP